MDETSSINSYNYIRPDHLELLSVEFVAMLVALFYFVYLAYKRRAHLEIALFLSLPFSDGIFRLLNIQPVEAISLLFVALNYKKIRLNYVLLIAGLFLLFSVLGYLIGECEDSYSFLYSLRFLLTAAVFTILSRSEFGLPASVVRFMVIFCFGLTGLQITLWLLGFPIGGIFFIFFPRAKGLAHEPGTWAIWLLALYPLILSMRLGRLYLLLNTLTMIMTLSTFGFTAMISFFVLRWIVREGRARILPRLAYGTLGGLLGLLCLGFFMMKIAEGSPQYDGFLTKLVVYAEELVDFSGKAGAEDITSGSGRGSDIRYFREKFPQYSLFGIGSFVSGNDPSISAANAYLIWPVELGLVGFLLLLTLLVYHYRLLLRHLVENNRDFLAFNLNLILMVAGIRCFTFHEIWYMQAATLRIAEDPDSFRKQIAR